MSGWWVVLGGSNDGPRVRCDRPEYGNAEQPWEMALALNNLYSPDWGTDLETNELEKADWDEAHVIEGNGEKAMHDTMMHRILERLSNDELACRVTDASLSTEDREAAFVMLQKRGAFKRSQRCVKRVRHQLL